MNYKTITLELLQEHPLLHVRLKQGRQLLAALEACSTDLRTRHQKLVEQLSLARPKDSPAQLSLESYEIAIQELTERLRAAGRTTDPIPTEHLLDFLRHHTPAE